MRAKPLAAAAVRDAKEALAAAERLAVPLMDAELQRCFRHSLFVTDL